MAKDESKRVRPALVQTNKDNFSALKEIRDYNPVNPAYSIAAITAAETELNTTSELEAQAIAAVSTARDNAVAREWHHHNLMLGARDQVVAQFGRDSLEAQAVGLKRRSEYKRPGRKSTKTPAAK